MGKKISELTKLSTVSGSELIPVVSNGENYTITPDQIKEGLITEEWIESKNYLTEQSLNEYSTTSEVETKIAEAKSEILGGAGEDYDTLKEIETWVTEHQDLYAGLVTSLSKKQDTITDLEEIRTNASTAKDWGNHASAGYLTKEEADSTYQTILPTGVNTATSVTSIPTSKTMCVVNTTSGDSFGLSDDLIAGQEVHIVINNTGSSKITISIPTTFKASVDKLEIESGKFGEINVISDGTNKYLRAV